MRNASCSIQGYSNSAVSLILTFPIVEVEFDGFALVDVKIREPNGKHKQNEQQKEFELLADLLQRKAHPHHSNITHSVENSDLCPFSVDVVQLECQKTLKLCFALTISCIVSRLEQI